MIRINARTGLSARRRRFVDIRDIRDRLARAWDDRAQR
jgi:hypothetical protein